MWRIPRSWYVDPRTTSGKGGGAKGSNRYHETRDIAAINGDAIVVRMKNNNRKGHEPQRLAIVLRENKDGKPVQQTQIDVKAFDGNEERALEWTKTLVDKFADGTIATKEQAEEFKQNKLKELGVASRKAKKVATKDGAATADAEHEDEEVPGEDEDGDDDHDDHDVDGEDDDKPLMDTDAAKKRVQGSSASEVKRRKIGGKSAAAPPSATSGGSSAPPSAAPSTRGPQT